MKIASSIPTLHEFDQSRVFFHLPLLHTTPAIDLYRLSTPTQHMSFPPARQGFYDISFFQNTTFEHKLGIHSNQMRHNSMHFVVPGVVQTITDVPKEDIDGYTLCFKPTFLGIGQKSAHFVKDFPFFRHGVNALLYLSEAESLAVNSCFERIEAAVLDSHPYRFDLARCHLLALLWYCRALFEQQTNTQSVNVPPRVQQLSDDFEQLLHQNLTNQRQLNFYAQRLGVSVQHLSETIKQVTGRTAKEVLIEAQVLEAKTLLLQTNLTVSQVAYELGYNEPSQFMHFFKRHIGLSPQQYRRGI